MVVLAVKIFCTYQYFPCIVIIFSFSKLILLAINGSCLGKIHSLPMEIDLKIVYAFIMHL